MDRVSADLVADWCLSAHSIIMTQLNKIARLAPIMVVAATDLRRFSILKLDSGVGCPASARRTWLYLDWRELGALHIID